MESVIQERNKVRDSERNRCGTSSALSNMEFKMSREVRVYPATLEREPQIVHFYGD